MHIKISYDGKYPCLCSGHLTVTVDGTLYDFGRYCLSSGGSVSFNEDWSEHVTSGPWSISQWPDNFPDDLREAVTTAVNRDIPPGCCGGCV